VFIDNKAQTVDADEISRNVATKTGNVLRHLGRRNRCGIIMATHPSLTGLNSGTGSAGSTGWFNTGRNQVNMTGPDDDVKDDGRRVLTKPKANYSASGQEIHVVWDQGCYRCTDEALKADAGLGKADKAERVFLTLLRIHNEQNIRVTATFAAQNYAPKVFGKHPRGERVPTHGFAKAMAALLESGRIENVPYGRPVNNTFHLVLKMQGDA
jgi:RecA-family ATPase